MSNFSYVQTDELIKYFRIEEPNIPAINEGTRQEKQQKLQKSNIVLFKIYFVFEKNANYFKIHQLKPILKIQVVFHLKNDMTFL